MLMRHTYPWRGLFCRMGLSALLLSPAARPLLDQLVANAFADESPSCRAAEVAPELLALADWPLDKEGAHVCAAAISPALEGVSMVPVEIVGHDPIPTVLADGYEETPVDPPGPPKEVLRRRLGRQSLAALESRELDEIRGGFEPPDSNLRFSFGIERAVYINGQLVASTVLNLKDLQVTSGAGMLYGAPLNGDAAGLLLVQNGLGNNFQVQVGPNTFGTVVQNSLDNQHIQTVTTINAAVNSGQVLRAMSIQSAIQNGLIDSLRR